jgi:membrane associated rhomboid family serine protease
VFPLKDNIPTDRLPVVTIALIVANVLVYFLLQEGRWEITSATQGTWNFAENAAYPCDLAGRCDEAPDDAPSVLTSMFMHGGLLHLGGNMLFLWIFGNNVEDSMGRLVFVAFYLAGGVAAIAAQTLADPSAAVPTVGASGAVSAVLGGYLLLYPRARVITVIFIVIFFTLIELPAVAVILLWFVQQAIFGALDFASGGEGGGVAYFAHIGGFLFGLLVIRLLARPKSYAPAPYRI